MPRARRRELLSKRMLGYVNWHRGRKYVHRRDILDLLTRDIVEQKPDHIAVTGDLVNLGLPEEFLRAAEWLHHLGPPEPRDGDPRQSRRLCASAPRSGHPSLAALHGVERRRREAVPDSADAFPFVRRFGDVALIALSSAIPTMPFIAAGKIGSAQRAFLANALDRLKQANLFRVVLIHHPPLREQAGWHRGLRDARRFTRVLRQHGAELVLHGHNHEQTVHELETATGPAIVIGVPSASEAVEGRIPLPPATTNIRSRVQARAGVWRWSGARWPLRPSMSGKASAACSGRRSLDAEHHRGEQPHGAGEDADGERRDHHAHSAPRRTRLEPEPLRARRGSASAISIRSRCTISCAM